MKLPLMHIPFGRFALALCVIGVTFLTAGTSSAQTFNQIQFTIATGGADLRNNCVATATLKSPGGQALQTITLYNGNGNGFANNTTANITATLSPALSAAQIGSIEITQIEHNGFGQTDNNWNINGVTVTLSNGGSGAQQLVSVSGNPWQRLTGSAPSQSITVPPPAAQQPAGTFNTIQFVVATGGADLRSDCDATATLMSPTGQALQTITLYGGGGGGFANNTTATINTPLNAFLKPSQIGSIVITQIEHNGFGETDNNWNINSITVNLSNNGSGAQQLVSVSGNPWQRLTGSAPSQTIWVPQQSPPGAFNTINFVIGTGGADLRSDCDATATLMSPTGHALQTITLYNGGGNGFANNTSATIPATLTTPLKPSQIGSIVFTQIEHNGFGETDNNWNINSITVSLSNNGSGAQEIASRFGNPLARLTGSQPSFTLAIPPQSPPGAFNTINFTIGTGGADLRSDCTASAALETADGTVLQTIPIYDGLGSGFANNSSTPVSATLNPPLKPSDIAHIVVTQVEHNGFGETDNNWNINNFTVSLSNIGGNSQNLMSFSGNPLARLTGQQPSVTLPPFTAKAGLGMTMPVTPPTETPNLNLNPNLMSHLLPFGYQLPPSGFLDTTSASMLTGSCSSSWKVCLPAWNGNVNEPDGRLNQFLRTNAQSHDAHLLLARAVWLNLNLSLPGNVAGMNCGGTNAACAAALAQLAVTGRAAFNSFVGWTPAFDSTASSGPQLTDLETLVQHGVGDLPALSSSITASQLETACNKALTEAYTALWAIRSNQQAWRQFRLTSGGWIAVSGEDDAPHRPVNVFTAPFPQFDVAVPVMVGGKASTLVARYMIAAGSNFMNLDFQAVPIQAPAIPMVTIGSCFTSNIPCVHRLTVPNDSPLNLVDGQTDKNVIIYIHGGGSRLEEAVPMAQQFVSAFPGWSSNVIVLSFDLPNSAYDDPMVTLADGGSRIPLDASSSAFENGPNGGSPANINNFPILNFTLNFINNLIGTLNQARIINGNQVLAVMGGSLGGNTSLLLGMNPIPSPFQMERPLAFTAPASAPGGAQPTIVSWSPTSMVSFHDNAGTISGNNMCCSVLSLEQPGTGWQTESSSTRLNYFHNLYLSDTTWLGGLPPDPEMWYRDDWSDASGNSATTSLITQSRFDRYEIYSNLARLWTTSVDTEQAVFSFQNNTDSSGQTYKPMYGFVKARLLMATGACDDYDNANNTSPFAPPPTISTGNCAGHGLGNTGSNVLAHQDIYGFTHDVANDMRNATGRTLFLNDTGHSIHDERPIFFAQQIQQFLTTPDNNINITLITGSDDLRWNSEAHALISIPVRSVVAQLSTMLDFPLNYWFHPWPGLSSIFNNPCGPLCYKLTAFNLPSGSGGNFVQNNFTIALPSGTSPSSISNFQLEFIAGTDEAGNTTDEWKLAAVAACLPGSSGGFVSDGFPLTGTLKDFNPSSNNQPVTWSPPSFQSPGTSSLPNNCSPTATNPPANDDVMSSIWNSGFLAQQ